MKHKHTHTSGRTRGTRLEAQLNTRLEAQLNTRLEAHKCGLGVLAIGTLVTRESGPNTVGGAESGVEGHHIRNPVDAMVVTNQPQEAEDEFEVAQLHHVSGKGFCVDPKNTESGSVVCVMGPVDGLPPSMISRGMGWVCRMGCR